ncbi:hypothetical protein CVT25_000343 [Psilocybe cyanescens]|uniref:Amidase domain-containing protein n=1 Tax=Psilocybe cyanescens TaxID=93625 RepID=A0A409VNS9_PSICY|nr:hypothetical protein CVT25_000343 [Psilocybe cyanescens]
MVGVKPTVGLTSRAGAIVLSIIAGKDPKDSHTRPTRRCPGYTRALDKNALQGKRIGVPRHMFLDDSISRNDPYVNVAFERASGVMRSLGATVVDPADLPSADETLVSHGNETLVCDTDLKVRDR